MMFEVYCIDKTVQCDLDKEELSDIHHNSANKKPFVCDVCQKEFVLKGHLLRHLRNHIQAHKYEDLKNFSERKKTRSCDSGQEEIFNESSDINNSSTNEKPFMCNVCQKGFYFKGNLTSHLRSHARAPEVRCNVCERVFSSKAYYKMHLVSCVPECSTFVCNTCGEKFSTEARLRHHTRTHVPEKPFKCNICQESFHSKSFLNAHCVSHAGENSLSCTVCNRKYESESSLQTHMRWCHKEEELYQCEICEKKFPFQSLLKYHLRSHTGEKPYTCDVCQKKYPHKASLKYHKLYGHKEKERRKCYTCDMCQRNFFDSAKLNKHRCVSGKRFVCNVCNKVYCRKRRYTTHLLTHKQECEASECDTNSGNVINALLIPIPDTSSCL